MSPTYSLDRVREVWLCCAPYQCNFSLQHPEQTRYRKDIGSSQSCYGTCRVYRDRKTPYIRSRLVEGREKNRKWITKVLSCVPLVLTFIKLLYYGNIINSEHRLADKKTEGHPATRTWSSRSFSLAGTNPTEVLSRTSEGWFCLGVTGWFAQACFPTWCCHSARVGQLSWTCLLSCSIQFTFHHEKKEHQWLKVQTLTPATKIKNEDAQLNQQPGEQNKSYWQSWKTCGKTTFSWLPDLQVVPKSKDV